MKHKKVLFIVDHLKGGGAEKILLEVAKKLSENHQVIIALMDSHDIRMPIPSCITAIDLNIHKAFMSGGLWRRKGRELRADEIRQMNTILDEESPDLVVLSHWYALHLSPYLKGNVWTWVHGDIFNPNRRPTPNLFRWYKENRRRNYELKYFPQLFAKQKLILVNHDLEKTYKPYIPEAVTQVIYNGIDIKSFSTDIAPGDAKEWDCIFVGRLSNEKQPDYALRAFANSELKGRMAIVGDGPLLPTLKKLAKQLGIEDRIDFLGWIVNVAPYISRSHLLIMSSREEGFGLVIAEALALDTPVVAFNCSNGVEFQLNTPELRRGLVEPQNIQSLSEKINEIYHHPYPITHVDKDRLSIERMITNFEDLM